MPIFLDEPIENRPLRKHRLSGPPNRPLPCDWKEVAILQCSGSFAFIYPIEGGHLVEIGREIQEPWKTFATTETSLEAVYKLAEPLLREHASKEIYIT